MIELLLVEAFLAFSVPYILLYRSDPLTVFRIGNASWNRVFSAFGIPFVAKKKSSRFFPLLIAGLAVDLSGIFSNSWGTVLAGSFLLLAYVTANAPVPFAPHEVALPYPRAGRAAFQKPRVKANSRGPVVDVSRIKLFYVSYRNGTVFSLPEGKVSIPELLVSFLEQTKPEFAWIQLIYRRADVHRYLEAQKWKLLREKETLGYSGKDPLWFSRTGIMLKKVDEMLSSELFAVAVRGVLIGADPMNITLGYSDEADSLAVFESEDPGLLYEMAKRELNVKLPKNRSEPPFFFANDLRSVASPPLSAKSVGVAPLGLQVLQSWEDEASQRYEAFELNPVPALEESFHFPADGFLELVYDGKLHVLAGGSLGKALLGLGSNAVPYKPLEAFKEKLETLT